MGQRGRPKGSKNSGGTVDRAEQPLHNECDLLLEVVGGFNRLSEEGKNFLRVRLQK